MLLDICAKLYEVDVSEIPLRHIVQLLCLFCPGFGRSCRCPPNTWTPDVARRVFEQFESCFVYVVYIELRNTTMRAVNSHMFSIGRRLVKLARQIGNTIVLPLGAGRTCRECTVARGRSCTAREKIPPSPEAVGVDVIALLRRLELPIEVPIRKYVVCTALVLTRRRFVVERSLSTFGNVPDMEPLEKIPLHKIPGAIPYSPVQGIQVSCEDCPLRDVCKRYYTWRTRLFSREN